MTWGFVALAGATVVSGVMAGEAADSAASASVEAGRIQADSAQKGVDEVRRQFDAITSLLKPYTAAGPQALSGIQDMLGLNGAEAQSAALAGVEGSPEMALLSKQGEDAILANASATGGLRGGNTQDALAQFRPALLSSLINDRFSLARKSRYIINKL